MKITQENDFDCSRTVYRVEVSKQDMMDLPHWYSLCEWHKEGTLEGFFLQLARLAAYKGRGCDPAQQGDSCPNKTGDRCSDS